MEKASYPHPEVHSKHERGLGLVELVMSAGLFTLAAAAGISLVKTVDLSRRTSDATNAVSTVTRNAEEALAKVGEKSIREILISQPGNEELRACLLDNPDDLTLSNCVAKDATSSERVQHTFRLIRVVGLGSADQSSVISVSGTDAEPVRYNTLGQKCTNGTEQQPCFITLKSSFEAFCSKPTMDGASCDVASFIRLKVEIDAQAQPQVGFVAPFHDVRTITFSNNYSLQTTAVSDTFWITKREASDPANVIFVIDNSNSMTSNQMRLAEGMRSVAGVLEGQSATVLIASSTLTNWGDRPYLPWYSFWDSDPTFLPTQNYWGTSCSPKPLFYAHAINWDAKCEPVSFGDDHLPGVDGDAYGQPGSKSLFGRTIRNAPINLDIDRFRARIPAADQWQPWTDVLYKTKGYMPLVKYQYTIKRPATFEFTPALSGPSFYAVRDAMVNYISTLGADGAPRNEHLRVAANLLSPLGLQHLRGKRTMLIFVSDDDDRSKEDFKSQEWYEAVYEEIHPAETRTYTRGGTSPGGFYLWMVQRRFRTQKQTMCDYATFPENWSCDFSNVEYWSGNCTPSNNLCSPTPASAPVDGTNCSPEVENWLWGSTIGQPGTVDTWLRSHSPPQRILPKAEGGTCKDYAAYHKIHLDCSEAICNCDGPYTRHGITYPNVYEALRPEGAVVPGSCESWNQVVTPVETITETSPEWRGWGRWRWAGSPITNLSWKQYILQRLAAVYPGRNAVAGFINHPSVNPTGCQLGSAMTSTKLRDIIVSSETPRNVFSICESDYSLALRSAIDFVRYETILKYNLIRTGAIASVCRKPSGSDTCTVLAPSDYTFSQGVLSFDPASVSPGDQIVVTYQ